MTILLRVRDDREAEYHMAFSTEEEAREWIEDHGSTCIHEGLQWRLFMVVC